MRREEKGNGMGEESKKRGKEGNGGREEEVVVGV